MSASSPNHRGRYNEDRINLDLYREKAELLRNEEMRFQREIKDIQLRLPGRLKGDRKMGDERPLRILLRTFGWSRWVCYTRLESEVFRAVYGF